MASSTYTGANLIYIGDSMVERDEKGRVIKGALNPKGGSETRNRKMNSTQQEAELSKLANKALKKLNKKLDSEDDNVALKAIGVALAEYDKANNRNMRNKKLLLEMKKVRAELDAKSGEKTEVPKDSNSAPVISFTKN